MISTNKKFNNLSTISTKGFLSALWTWLLVPIILTILLFALSACSGNTNAVEKSSQTSNTEFSVTDLSNREIHFDKPAERVVSLTASDCEILYAINAGDMIVGRGTYCDYPAEVSEIQDVGSGTLTSIESIISLKPDVVFMSKMGQTTAQVDALTNAGIKVVVNDASTIQDTYKYIEIIGKVVGHEQQSQTVIADMKQTFDDISNKVKGKNSDNKYKVYFEVSPLQYGLWTAGSNTFMQEIAEMMNMTNVFDDVAGWSEVSQEQIIGRNPNVIIAVTMYSGNGQRPEDEIMSRNGWDKIDAVNNKAVYNVDSNIITRPGPRLADAAKIIFENVYK